MNKKNQADLQQELLNTLDEICEQLDLKVVTLASEEDGMAKGIIIGAEDFLAEIIAQLGAETHEEFGVDEQGEFAETQEIAKKVTKKKESYH